jgi:hypothetical protein
MSGSGKGDQTSRLQDGYNRGATAYQSGQTIQGSGVTPGASNLSDAWITGFNQAAAAAQRQQQQEAMMAQMFSGFGHAAPVSTGPSYEQQQADQQAEYDRRMEEQRVAQGRADTNAAYSDYLSAANSATDYINTEITKQQANADLLGIDFSITDEQKQERINNYFATIWDEGKQNTLDSLRGQFGDPDGFGGFSVVRGDPSKYTGKGKGKETLVTASSGQKAKTLLDTEEYALGASGTLGV